MTDQTKPLLTGAHPFPMCVCLQCGPPWRVGDDWTSTGLGSWMVLCPTCGSKRCPGAIDHRRHPADEEAQHTPVSAPSGPSAGLEGQDATQETPNATEAARGRVERFAEAMDDVPFTGYDGRQRQLMAYAAMAVADQEQAELRAEVANLQTESAGWQDAAGSANDRAEAAEARVAERDATIADLRAEVERLRKPTVAAVMGYELGAGDLEHAEARVAELEATVAKVRAQADEWAAIDGDGMTIPWPVADSLMHKAAADLRAILDAPKDTTAP